MSSPPSKPPRGVKTKETSRLLLSVIRTLSTSESNEQREHEKTKLQKEYNRSDQQLNELVSKHESELTRVMKSFTNISNNITTSKEKLRGMKELLIACKTLLNCRRDELKKLWLEGVEQKQILILIEEIEKLKEVPSQLATYLSNNEHLEAAKLLASALNVVDDALEGVEALSELKSELHHKKEKLYILTLGEIRRIVFIEASKLSKVCNNDGSFRDKSQRRCHIFSVYEEKYTYNDQHFEEELLNLTECLALLKKIPDANVDIKNNMQVAILDVIDRVTETVMNGGRGDIHPFQDLLETLLEEIRNVTYRFNNLINCFNSLCQKYEVTCNIIQASDLQNTVQSMLQSLLADYLDIQNTSNDPQVSYKSYQDVTDTSLYFSKRKIPRNSGISLFKFEKSSVFNSLNHQACLTQDEVRNKVFVCSPDPANIAMIITPIRKFNQEIENIPGVTCTLNTFINDYVKTYS